MNIKSVGIIGGTNGLGARFAEYFTETFPHLEVLASGRNTEISNKIIVQKCDLVIFAVPIDCTVEVIESLVDDSRPDQLWVDFTSIKQQPVAAMLESSAQVCGLHPLFGPLPEIEGQTLIYCPARIEPESLSALLKLLAGFNLMEFSPQQHDDLMGVVQCASHLSELVMAETIRRSEFDFNTVWQVASPSYRLKLEVMGRMFAQNPELYADIATQNLSAAKFTSLFKAATQDLEAVVEAGDREKLIKYFDQSRQCLTPEFCASAYEASQHFLAAYTAGESANTEVDTKADIAIFGEPGSHTDDASVDLIPVTGEGTKRYFKNVFRLVEALQAGLVQHAVVPYENTTEGSVTEVLDELLAHPDIQIVGSTLRPIQQFLMMNDGGQLSSVKRVLSHPQALAQSKTFLRAELPQAELQPAASTASAARRVKQAQNASWAAVGSADLAAQLGLQIVSPNMADPNNRTRFVALQKNGRAETSTVSSLVFWFSADQSGNLAMVLNFFSEQSINLLKLDSRRAGEDKGGFVFFVDAEISLEHLGVHLPELKRIVAGVEILGAY